MNLKKSLGLVLLLMLLVGACKKVDSVNNTALLEKEKNINEWLNGKIGNGLGLSAQIAKGIKENLQFSKMGEADFGGGRTLVFIPLNDGYKFKNNQQEQQNNYLVIFKNSEGKIIAGNVWQALNGAWIKQNTIINYFTNKEEDLQGRYCLLDIRDNFIKEVKYDNNKIIEVSQRNTKSLNTNNRNTTENCTEYFVVRTHYNGDTNEVLYQEVLYSFQICGCGGSNTVQTTIIGPGECDSNGNGAGGSSFTESDAHDGINQIMAAAVFSHSTNMSVICFQPVGQIVTSPFTFRCAWGDLWEVFGNSQHQTSVNNNQTIKVHSVTNTPSYTESLGMWQITHGIRYINDAQQEPIIINYNNTPNPKSIIKQRGQIECYCKVPGYTSISITGNTTGELYTSYRLP